MAHATLAAELLEEDKMTQRTESFQQCMAEMMGVRGEPRVIATYTPSTSTSLGMQALRDSISGNSVPYELETDEDGDPTGHALGLCLCGHNSTWHKQITEDNEFRWLHVGECFCCEPGQCTGYHSAPVINPDGPIYSTCACGHTSIAHELTTGACTLCPSGYCPEMNPNALKNFQIGE